MVHKLVVLEWLYRADQDFNFAKHSLIEQNLSYFDQICFFFHQAAEKYIKAYIVKFDLKFQKLHDLVKLLQICQDHDAELEVLKESAAFLTPFYTETRYTDEVFAIATKEQAEEACRHAEKIQQLIRKKLSMEREIAIEEINKENELVDKELNNENLVKPKIIL